MHESKIAIAKSILGDDLGYLREKLGNLLQDLHRVAEVSQGEQLNSRAQRQELASALSGAVSDVVKLLAVSSGEQLTNGDVEQFTHEVLTNGRDGYESVAYSLGLIEETTKHRGWRELRNLLARIEKAIGQTRAEARTRIAEMLAPYECDSRPLLQALVQATDRVSLGDVSWTDYQVEVKRIINRIRDKHLPDLY